MFTSLQISLIHTKTVDFYVKDLICYCIRGPVSSPGRICSLTGLCVRLSRLFYYSLYGKLLFISVAAGNVESHRDGGPAPYINALYE